jgi:hypothetical protein
MPKHTVEHAIAQSLEYKLTCVIHNVKDADIDAIAHEVGPLNPSHLITHTENIEGLDILTGVADRVINAVDTSAWAARHAVFLTLLRETTDVKIKPVGTHLELFTNGVFRRRCNAENAAVYLAYNRVHFWDHDAVVDAIPSTPVRSLSEFLGNIDDKLQPKRIEEIATRVRRAFVVLLKKVRPSLYSKGAPGKRAGKATQAQKRCKQLRTPPPPS